jgi:hypothetical protein
MASSHHQPSGNSAAPGCRVDQQLCHVRPVLLVGRYGEVELDRPHDLSRPARDDHAARSGTHSGQHLVAPESASLVEGERDCEAYTGASVHDGMQDLGKLGMAFPPRPPRCREPSGAGDLRTTPAETAFSD